MHSTAKKRNDLTLEEKVEVIRFLQNGNSERKAADKFCVSKGSIGNIKKRSKEYLDQYSDLSIPNNIRRNGKPTENEEINHLTWEWFKKIRAADIPVSGPMLQLVAKKFAEELNNTAFAASNGWLERFRTRHQISFKVLSGESDSADLQEAQNFASRFKELCEGYAVEDIFNADETGLFFRALPKKTLLEKYQKSEGKKFSKERISIMLCSSMLGEKLKPFVIGKAKRPRCFKNVNVNGLPITWKANKKAWMTSVLFEEWLKDLNMKMIAQNRKILLFVDQCPSHCEVQLSNIKLKFLPCNTTSLVQPLDQGIIKNFKTLYRNLFIKHLIAESATQSAEQLASYKINLLDAVHWVDEAWKQVNESCIKNCFRKAGFNVFSVNEVENSSQIEEEIDCEHFNMARNLNIIEDEVSYVESVSFDDGIHIDSKENDINKIIKLVLEEQNINRRNQIMEIEGTKDNDSQENSDDDEIEEEPYLLTYQQVAMGLKQLKVFATTQEPELLGNILDLVKKFEELQIKRALNKKQTTLCDYFNSIGSN